jgi:hypothetical protein
MNCSMNQRSSLRASVSPPERQQLIPPKRCDKRSDDQILGVARLVRTLVQRVNLQMLYVAESDTIREVLPCRVFGIRTNRDSDAIVCQWVG